MELVKILDRRLGRLIPSITPHLNPDPSVLKFSDYRPKAVPLPALKPYSNWAKYSQKPWGMLGNDTLGDCTCAAVGHAVQVVTSCAGIEAKVTDAEIITMYEASGYVPGNPSTDNGWYIQNALQYWQTTGVGGHKIAGFIAINPHNMQDVDLAIQLFGFVNIGILLPVSAQNQNGIWTVPEGGPNGNGAPGSWGGHSIIATTRSPFRREIITWGQSGWKVSENFWLDYVDECWTAFTMDWLKKSGDSPSGFDKAALLSDMSALGMQTPAS